MGRFWSILLLNSCTTTSMEGDSHICNVPLNFVYGLVVSHHCTHASSIMPATHGMAVRYASDVDARAVKERINCNGFEGHIRLMGSTSRRLVLLADTFVVVQASFRAKLCPHLTKLAGAVGRRGRITERAQRLDGLWAIPCACGRVQHSYLPSERQTRLNRIRYVPASVTQVHGHQFHCLVPFYT